MEFGVIELTTGVGVLLITVSEVLPTRLQLLVPVWLKTCTVKFPTLSPGNDPEILVAFVG